MALSGKLQLPCDKPMNHFSFAKYCRGWFAKEDLSKRFLGILER